nr:hypothetical protein CFP56_00344 [Quercus suber]
MRGLFCGQSLCQATEEVASWTTRAYLTLPSLRAGDASRGNWRRRTRGQAIVSLRGRVCLSQRTWITSASEDTSLNGLVYQSASIQLRRARACVDFVLVCSRTVACHHYGTPRLTTPHHRITAIGGASLTADNRQELPTCMTSLTKHCFVSQAATISAQSAPD